MGGLKVVRAVGRKWPVSRPFRLSALLNESMARKLHDA